MKKQHNLSLIDHFSVLPDPRREHHNTKQHLLIDIIVIAVLGVMCGADTWVDIAAFGREKEQWLTQFLDLPGGIPSHDTFGRVFALLDPDAFQRCFFSWVRTVSKKTKGRVVAIDGKAVRRSHGKDADPMEIITAFATTNGVALGQRHVDPDSNEITAVPELLDMLFLKGCIVTTDAMGCQGWIVKKIREKNADYVLAVKGNQRRLHHDIRTRFKTEAGRNGTQYHRTTETGHGREEIRECWATDDLSMIRDTDRWDDLASIARVTHTRIINGTTTTQTRHYISSLPTRADQILSAVRNHWRIENSLHWVLDVSFREDESRIRIGHAQENLALVRKLALNLLRKEETAKGGIKNKRLRAAWNDDYLLQIVGMDG